MGRVPQKLNLSFYNRKDVVLIARELLGKILVTRWDGIRSSGRIVETEAYAGVMDRASHAFGGRNNTFRTFIRRSGYFVCLYQLWYASSL